MGSSSRARVSSQVRDTFAVNTSDCDPAVVRPITFSEGEHPDHVASAYSRGGFFILLSTLALSLILFSTSLYGVFHSVFVDQSLLLQSQASLERAYSDRAQRDLDSSFTASANQSGLSKKDPVRYSEKASVLSLARVVSEAEDHQRSSAESSENSFVFEVGDSEKEFLHTDQCFPVVYTSFGVIRGPPVLAII